MNAILRRRIEASYPTGILVERTIPFKVRRQMATTIALVARSLSQELRLRVIFDRRAPRYDSSQTLHIDQSNEAIGEIIPSKDLVPLRVKPARSSCKIAISYVGPYCFLDWLEDSSSHVSPPSGTITRLAFVKPDPTRPPWLERAAEVRRVLKSHGLLELDLKTMSEQVTFLSSEGSPIDGAPSVFHCLFTYW